MTDCWGCTKSAETGLPGFVQAGCEACAQREYGNSLDAFDKRAREIEAKAREIARRYVGKWEARKNELLAEMGREWPIQSEFNRGRRCVWAHIRQMEGA